MNETAQMKRSNYADDMADAPTCRLPARLLRGRGRFAEEESRGGDTQLEFGGPAHGNKRRRAIFGIEQRGQELVTPAQRTVYALARDKPIDLFSLRRRYEFLSPLFDAEYGSATFVPVSRPAELELRISTSGLLLREATPPAK